MQQRLLAGKTKESVRVARRSLSPKPVAHLSRHMQGAHHTAAIAGRTTGRSRIGKLMAAEAKDRATESHQTTP